MDKKIRFSSYPKVFGKRSFFRFLLESNKCGIFALVNERQKKIFICSSQDIMKTLGLIISQLSSNTHSNRELRKDKKRLQFMLVEEMKGLDTRYLFIHKIRWIHHYESLGYHIYNTGKIPKYTIKTFITDDFKMQVRIVSKGLRIFKVAEFSTNEEAQFFIQSHTLYDMLKIVYTHEHI